MSEYSNLYLIPTNLLKSQMSKSANLWKTISDEFHFDCAMINIITLNNELYLIFFKVTHKLN